jgi:hypothetical protein
MVDVAEARNWQALRVSGHEDFKRMVWLEASIRGVRALGYEPQTADIDSSAANERPARPTTSRPPCPTTPTGPDPRGASNPRAVAAERPSSPPSRRARGQARPRAATPRRHGSGRREARQQIAAGQTHRVKVYDKAAPPSVTWQLRRPSNSEHANVCRRADTSREHAPCAHSCLQAPADGR